MKSAWIPSPLIPAGGRQDVPIVPVRRPSRLRPIAVTAQFGVLVVAGLAVLLRLSTIDAFARRMRALFERLGGLWIKAGQVLALRIDFLPEALCVELSRLQSRSMGFPGAAARAIVEAELGGELERWFDEWDERPLAAASIGQVHRARL
ncbi:MAG: AarF/UbiB family protein, partial [Vicinamibacterales bacterium]